MTKRSKKSSNCTSFYDDAIRIQRKLKKYSSISILNLALSYLSEESPDKLSRLKKMPWVMMLLIKWSYLNSNNNTSNISEKRFNEIAQEIYSLQTKAFNAAKEKTSFFLKVRPLILQQMHYQTNPTEQYFHLLRQTYWFLDSAESEYYKSKFQHLTSIPIKSYLLITYTILALLTGSNKNITAINISDLIYQLCPAVKPIELLKYLSLLGQTEAQISSFLKRYKQDIPQAREYFEDTPFIFKPLIVDRGRVIIICRELLISSMCDMIPIQLKSEDKEKFKINFGITLERYVESLLKLTNTKYKTETQLKKELGRKGKVVDFLIGEKLNILIDSKAIEPSSFINTCIDPETIYSRLEGSFIKGIWQGQECALKLNGKNGIRTSYKMLIVTHREYHIKSGHHVLEAIRPQLHSEILEQLGSVEIDLRSIFYCTISDLELLLTANSAGSLDIEKFLDYCIEKDSDPLTARMIFRQHLEEYLKGLPAPRYKTMRELKITEFNLEVMLKENNKTWKYNTHSYTKLCSEMISRLSN